MINFYGVKGLQEKAGSVISAKSDTFAVSKAIGGPLPTKTKRMQKRAVVGIVFLVLTGLLQITNGNICLATRSNQKMSLYIFRNLIDVNSGHPIMRNQLQIESKQIPGTWVLAKQKKIGNLFLFID